MPSLFNQWLTQRQIQEVEGKYEGNATALGDSTKTES